MKERPVIFNSEMVRAILDGRKTQTRRALNWKRQPYTEMAERDDGSLWPWAEDGERGGDIWFPCPFGEVGDRLWVREMWAEAGASAPDLTLYRANYPAHVPAGYENVPAAEEIRWRPSIHMPRWASRILLEITAVRVELLNDISEEDARAEGISDGGCLNCGESEPCGCAFPDPDATDAFAYLWQSIYGLESWFANPWVWVVEFKRVEAESD